MDSCRVRFPREIHAEHRRKYFRAILHRGHGSGFVLLLAAIVFPGCASWQVEYGTPRAHLLAPDVAMQGGRFVGSVITAKGVVTRIDVSDRQGPMVYLRGGVQCNFGRLTTMAASCKVGEEVVLDGYLRRCDESGVLLYPAVLTGRKFPPPHSPR